MQRKTNKKGFTIVELVIVIAVIAILAAVLIPTFSGLVDKARMSADQQAVVNMNKILSYEEKADDVDGVIELLIDNEYAGDLTTYYKKYSLAWVESENKIVLIENNKIAYPAQYVDKNLSYELINPMATDADALVGNLTDGNTVYIAEDITLAEGLAPSQAGDYLVNLNGNTLISSDYVGAWTEDANLVVSNGVIDARTSEERIAVYTAGNATVELNNVQIYAASGVNPVQIYGGNTILNNVTTAQYGQAETSWYNSAIQIANHITKDENDVWYFDGGLSSVTVNGGMYSGDKAIQMSAPGGTVVINGGTFIGTTAAINADFNQTYKNQGATYSITINDGNFTGMIKVHNNITLVINGGTFDFDPSTGIVYSYNATTGAKTYNSYENITINGTVVDNGNGTWTVK